MKKSKKIDGYTMVEILVAIAVFVMVATAGIVGFTNSNRMSELKNATDKLAEDIRDIQVKAQANVKEIDNLAAGAPYSTYNYEEGYKLKFTVGDPSAVGQIKYSELMSQNEIISQAGNAIIYYLLPDIALDNKHRIAKFELWDETFTTISFENSGDDYNIIFLFPDAQSLLIDNDNNTLSELGSQDDRMGIKIYLKHDDLADWRGVVTFDRASGKISTEIVSVDDQDAD